MLRSKPNLVLVGFMGAGKSATGRAIAARMGRSFVDLDQVIASQAGMTISEIFARQGESAFRRMEAEAANFVARRTGLVIATGGGTLTNPESFTALRQNGVIVWLAPPLEVLLKRLSGKRSHRPLVRQGPEALKALYHERVAYYRLADIVVCPNQQDTVLSVADQIIHRLDQESATFQVATPTANYPFRLSQGFNFPELAKIDPAKTILVSDETVDPLYGDQAANVLTAAGWRVQRLVFPAGESSKTLANVEKIWETGFDFGLDRHGMIAALGGGVIGDLAGFAAATYMRGVRFLIIPTTLLAMVDSSVGGKVGINHVRGKNLIGAFHHPEAVLAPISCLNSLDERNLAAGWSEVVKSALIGDAPYYQHLLADRPRLQNIDTLSEAVFRSARVKADIVAVDEFERGARKYLNLGHTLGHGIEHALGFGTLLHGEAVAIGMVFAAYAAEKLGLAEVHLTGALRELLTAYGLPVKLPLSLEITDLIGPVQLDKKNQGSKITLIIPIAPGKVLETKVSSTDFAQMIEEFRGEV